MTAELDVHWLQTPTLLTIIYACPDFVADAANCLVRKSRQTENGNH